MSNKFYTLKHIPSGFFYSYEKVGRTRLYSIYSYKNLHINDFGLINSHVNNDIIPSSITCLEDFFTIVYSEKDLAGARVWELPCFLPPNYDNERVLVKHFTKLANIKKVFNYMKFNLLNDYKHHKLSRFGDIKLLKESSVRNIFVRDFEITEYEFDYNNKVVIPNSIDIRFFISSLKKVHFS